MTTIKQITHGAGYITGCTNCGGDEFIITESTIYGASVDDTGTLSTYTSPDSYTDDLVICRSCDTHYTVDDFTSINFN